MKNYFRTNLSESIKVGDKIIKTKDWGSFKLRKNGKVILSLGTGNKRDLVRVTPL